MRARGKRLWLIAVLVMAAALPAYGSGFPVDPSDFSNPDNLISQSIADAFVTTIGLAAGNRPYRPATPLGIAAGLELAIELTLMKVPPSFNAALSQAGLSNSASALPVVPVPKVQLHKGLGDNVDVGFSGIAYQDYRILGGDLAIAVSHPEEGPTWALRFNYSNSQLGFVQTQTFSPELVVSRKLEFADPYVGIGYQYAVGKIVIPITTGVTAEKYGSGSTFASFLGVSFNIPRVALLLVIEGSYASVGTDTIGTKFGFCF